MKHIIANFKSNKSPEEYKLWLDVFEKSSKNFPSHLRIILAPSFPSLLVFADKLRGNTQSTLAIQDLSPYSAGAYTGAVSSHNIKGLGVTHAIIGHSERRKYFHETSIDVANKVTQCLEADITPIVCVATDQINEQANAIKESERSKVIVAFEPIEHIGTGEADSLEHILEIKKHVQIAFGDVPFIYGGSVDPNTDGALLIHKEIDGFLVGSASLKVDVFCSLLSMV